MSATVDWSVVEDEQEWQKIQTSLDLAESAPAAPVLLSARVGELRLAALAVALFLLLAGVWLWQKQLMLATIASELQGTVAQEVGTGPTGSEPGVQLRLESPTPAAGQAALPVEQAGSSAHAVNTEQQPAVQIDDYHLQGDRAMAEVTVRYPAADGEMLAYRETRFYRQTDAGWQHIDPDPALMGPWQTLETEHFTIRYRPVDAIAVTEAAPRLDLLYDKMGRDFGLPAIAATSSFTIEVVTHGLPDGYDIRYTGRTMMVPSPTMLSVPVEMTEATVFYQSVVYPLTSLALMDAIDPHPNQWKLQTARWQPFPYALRLWELWEDGGPLAAGRQEVVRWLYQNAQAKSVDARQAVPAGYDQLCRTYRIWGVSPESMAIPLGCSDVDTERWSAWRYPAMPSRLVPRPYIEKDGGQVEEASDSTVAIETIIEYVAATYGRDHLPRLLAALGEHASWQTLIPAVFAVSARDFEAGWQEYLATHYGIGEIR
jgi:hypothetical protein